MTRRGVSAERADLTLAAAPLAAGVGQPHHHTAAFAVVPAQGLQDLFGDDGSDRPPAPEPARVFQLEAAVYAAGLGLPALRDRLILGAQRIYFWRGGTKQRPLIQIYPFVYNKDTALDT